MTECIYVIAESQFGPVKIGRSMSPRSRLSSLQTGNPRPLELAGAWMIDDGEAQRAEMTMHAELMAQNGVKLIGEWFDYSPSLFDDDYMNDFFAANGLRGRRII